MDYRGAFDRVWDILAGWRATLYRNAAIRMWCRELTATISQDDIEVISASRDDLAEAIRRIVENREEEIPAQMVIVDIPPKVADFYELVNEFAPYASDQPADNASQAQALGASEENLETTEAAVADGALVPLPPAGAEQLQVGAYMEIEEQIFPCIASFAPGAQDCTWKGKMSNMCLHLAAEHHPHFLHTNEIIVEPTKHKLLRFFNDFFVCYATFHHRDLICVVEHACPCSTNYAYRCILISENNRLPHLSSNVRLALNELKDFKLLRKHPRVARFRNCDVEPRKDFNKRISVWIKLFHPSSITEAPEEGCILLPKSEDLPHIGRNVMHAPNEENKAVAVASDLRTRQLGSNDANKDMDVLVAVQTPTKTKDERLRQKVIPCPMNFVPGAQVCAWVGCRELLFMHMMKVHEENMQHTNNVLLEPTKYKVLHFLNEIFMCYIAHDNKDIVCVVLHAGISSIPYLYRCFLISVTQELPHVVSDMLPVLTKSQEHRIVRRLPNVVRFKQSEVRPRKYGGNRTSIFFEICPPNNIIRPGALRNYALQPVEEERERLTMCALQEARPSDGCPWIGSSLNLWQHLIEEHKGHVRECDSIVLQPMHCGLLQCHGSDYLCYCTYDQDDLVCTMWSAAYGRPCRYRCILISATEVPDLEAGELRSQKWYNALKMIIGSRYVTRFLSESLEERKSAQKVTEVKFQVTSLRRSQITREEKDNMNVCCLVNGMPGTRPCPWAGLWKSYPRHLETRHPQEYYSDCTIMLQVMKCKVLAAYGDVFICYVAFDGEALVCKIYHPCPCGLRYPYRVTLMSEDRRLPDVATDVRFIHTATQTFQQIQDSPSVVHFDSGLVEARRSASGNISVMLEIFSPVTDNTRRSCSSKEECSSSSDESNGAGGCAANFFSGRGNRG